MSGWRPDRGPLIAEYLWKAVYIISKSFMSSWIVYFKYDKESGSPFLSLFSDISGDIVIPPSREGPRPRGPSGTVVIKPHSFTFSETDPLEAAKSTASQGVSLLSDPERPFRYCPQLRILHLSLIRFSSGEVDSSAPTRIRFKYCRRSGRRSIREDISLIITHTHSPFSNILR